MNDAGNTKEPFFLKEEYKITCNLLELKMLSSEISSQCFNVEGSDYQDIFF